MKIVLVLVGVLALAAVLVVVIGALLPKHHVASRSAHFRAKPATLFSIIAGPSTWRTAVKKYEPLEARRWRETDSQGESIEYEVVESDPPTLLKTRIATSGLPYSGGWTFALTEDASGTTVRITEEGDVYNPVFRFVSRFLIGHTRSLDASLHDLGNAAGEHVQVTD